MRHKNVLVTGGLGFIGSHLVDRLNSLNNVDVRVLDNLSSSVITVDGCLYWNSGLEFIRGDLTNFEDAVKAVEGCEVVFHLAANPEVRSAPPAPMFTSSRTSLQPIICLRL